MNRPRWYGIVLFAATVRLASANELPTETFSGSTSGWQDRDAGKMIVSHLTTGGNPGGCVRLVFPSQSVAFPQADALVATGQAASAYFTGDYAGAGAMMMGFDFRAEQVLPGALWIKLYSGSKVVYRDVTAHVLALDAWQPVRVSLVSSSLGGWLGDVESFFDVLGDVVRVEIQVTRHGEATQRYYVDNLFLDRVPEAAPGVMVAAGEPGLIWQNLRPGDSYRVEATLDLAPPAWFPAGRFTASGDVMETPIPATNRMMFYRLSID